ncbi:DUF624 domain-containing protein [Deinococcus sonorensis]|uniref:DUF624 domain-containing protein n=2 Tax=Deinococcus sonorensis TaxID=309891 RepID=A0AAU7UFJ4_9DEIO
MRLPRAYREGGLLTWHHLLTLVWLNLIWLVLAWTVVLAGPATLAVYALIATTMRQDRDPDLRRFLPLLRQNVVPGVLWLLTTALVAFVLYSNVVYWQRVLGPFGKTVLTLVAAYLAWLYVALQPYLLEALSVERLPYLRAWRAALLNLGRHPVSAHLYVLVPVVLVLLSLLTRTFVMIVLVSVALTFAAVQVRPFEPLPEPLDDPADPAAPA